MPRRRWKRSWNKNVRIRAMRVGNDDHYGDNNYGCIFILHLPHIKRIPRAPPHMRCLRAGYRSRCYGYRVRGIPVDDACGGTTRGVIVREHRTGGARINWVIFCAPLPARSVTAGQAYRWCYTIFEPTRT